MPLRLHQDHANARMLAETLAQIPEVEIDLEGVQTNIVVFTLRTRKPAEISAALKARGLLISSVGRQSLRLVTHHDADREACLRAAEILAQELAAGA
jgi:threonine aldolase